MTKNFIVLLLLSMGFNNAIQAQKSGAQRRKVAKAYKELEIARLGYRYYLLKKEILYANTDLLLHDITEEDQKNVREDTELEEKKQELKEKQNNIVEELLQRGTSVDKFKDYGDQEFQALIASKKVNCRNIRR